MEFRMRQSLVPFAVLLTVGIVTVAAVTLATVVIGPTLAGPGGSSCSNVK